MSNITAILNDPQVQKEIEIYKWLQSEKQGHDIGYAAASMSWLSLFGADWVKHNAPGNVIAAEVIEIVLVVEKENETAAGKSNSRIKTGQA